MTSEQQRVGAVLSRLTAQEIGSLVSGRDVWHSVSIPAKGIKAFRMSDGPNGIRGIHTFNGSRTAAFPCATALAATWNRDLVYNVGVEMAGQAKGKGVSVVLAPTVNIHRSPLGGRSFESFSEDPFLSGKLGGSLVRGLQDQGVSATLKHFVCNDQETDRMHVNTIVNERTLREIYLKPFQIIAREAKPWAIMAAYNRVNGIHVSEDPRLLNGILRDEWGWDGLIMSDWFGVSSSAESLNSGLDLEMPGPTIWRSSEQLLRIIGAGKVSLPTIIARAKNVATLMDRVSSAGIEERAIEQETDTIKSRAIVRKAAQEAIVLLKNSTGLLPLKNSSNILVIGPNAKRNLSTGGGSASLNQYYYVSAFDGIKEACTKRFPEAKVSFSQGCFAHEMLPLLLTQNRAGDEGFDLEFFGGSFDAPGSVQARVSTKSAQMVFFDSLPKEVTLPTNARVTSVFIPEIDAEYEFSLITTGRARLFVNDELVVSSWDKQEPSTKFFGLASKEIKGTISLKQLKSYQILIQYSSISSFTDRKATPLGGGILRIGATPILDPLQLVADAVKAAANADTVILCLGTDQERESEGYDRADMKLVGRQNELTEAILASNPSTVIVNFSGTPVEMPWAHTASTILQAWFLGSELGNAVADVIFGDFNPCGKLPVSFPAKIDDTPSFGNFPGENGHVRYEEGLEVGYRHYTTRSKQTLFEFGHGLSYTRFAYRDLYAPSWILDPREEIEILVELVNVGSVVGSEIVQLYISPLDATVFRPKRELQGFEKFSELHPGAEATIRFIIDKYSVSWYDEGRACWVAERGRYNVEIGSSSENIVRAHEMIIKETLTWTGV